MQKTRKICIIIQDIYADFSINIHETPVFEALAFERAEAFAFIERDRFRNIVTVNPFSLGKTACEPK